MNEPEIENDTASEPRTAPPARQRPTQEVKALTRSYAKKRNVPRRDTPKAERTNPTFGDDVRQRPSFDRPLDPETIQRFGAPRPRKKKRRR